MPWKRRSSSGNIANVLIVAFMHVFIVGWFMLLFTAAEEESQKPEEAAPIVFENKNNNPVSLEFSSSDPVEQMLSQLNYSVRSSIKEVRVEDDQSHYGENIGVVGHCHKDGTICVKSWVLEIKPSVVWHEAGHAYILKSAGSSFLAEWKSAPGGPLTSYARKSVDDDVCEWFEQCKLALNGERSAFDRLSSYERHGHMEKLRLMRNAGFITESEYIKMSEIILR